MDAASVMLLGLVLIAKPVLEPSRICAAFPGAGAWAQAADRSWACDGERYVAGAGREPVLVSAGAADSPRVRFSARGEENRVTGVELVLTVPMAKTRERATNAFRRCVSDFLARAGMQEPPELDRTLRDWRAAEYSPAYGKVAVRTAKGKPEILTVSVGTE